MADFETTLRVELAKAADQAPGFTGLDVDASPTPRSMLRRRAVMIAAALIVVTVGVSWWASGLGDDDNSDASCASKMTFDGRGYVAHGEGLRTPRPGDMLGSGSTSACADGNGTAGGGDLEVFQVPGIEPRIAVFARDHLWLSEDEPTAAAAVQEFERLVTCEGAAPRTISGQLTAISGPPPKVSYHVDAPYVATFVADEGEHLLLDQYSSVTVRLRVTDKTVGGEEPDLISRALGDGQRLTATVRCDGTTFDALSFSLAR